MAYAGMDPEGARDLAARLTDAAARAESARRDVLAALALADLESPVPLGLYRVHNRLDVLGASLTEKVGLAERPIELAAANDDEARQSASGQTVILHGRRAPELHEVAPFSPPPQPGQAPSFTLQPGEHYLQFGDQIMVDGQLRTLDHEETFEAAPGVIIHVVPPDRMPQSLLNDGLVRVAAKDVDPFTGWPTDAAVAEQEIVPTVAPPETDVFDPTALPALVRDGVAIETARAARPAVIDLPPEPPGILERVSSWVTSLFEPDPFETVTGKGFTANPVLDGEIALSRDFTIGNGLSGGFGIAVQGPNSASYQALGGARFGATISDGRRSPVTDPAWISSSGLTAVAWGLGGAVGLNTSYTPATGDSVKDYYALINIPYVKAIGVHAIFEEDSWIPAIRRADPNDVPDGGIVIGPGFLAGMDRPIAGDPALAWVLDKVTGGKVGTDDAVVGLLSAFTGVPLEDVRLNSYVPAGTRLSFHPDEGVLAAADAGFGSRPGLDYDAATSIGPALTGTELAAAAPDGTALSFGPAPPFGTAPDDGMALLDASMPAGVSIDSVDPADWSAASPMDTDSWPLPDGIELGSGSSDFSLGGGYDDLELPPLSGYSFDDTGFSEDAWSSVEVVDFGGEL